MAIFPNASPSTILFPTTNTATATTITAFASPTIIAPSLGNESVSGVGANSQIQSIATNFVFSSDLIGPLVTDVPVLTLVSPSTSTDDFADVTTADLTSTISDLTTTSTIDPGVILSPSPSDTASTNSLTQSSGDPSISQNIIRISAGVAGGVVLLILFFVLIKFGLASRRRKAEYERDMDLEDAFANDSNPVRSSIMIPSNAGFYPPSQGFIPLNTAPMMVQNQKYAVPQEQVLRPFEPPQMIHVPQAYGGVGIDSNMPMDGNITGAYALSDEYNRKRNNDNGPAHPSQNNVAAPTSYPTGSTARQHDSYILASTNTSFQRFENNNSTSRDSSNKQSTISPDYDSIKTNSIMPPMNSTGKYMKPISHWSKDSVRLSTNNHPNNKNREQMQDILMRHTSLYSSLDSSEMPMNSKNTSVINGKPITRNSSTAKMESKLIRPPSDVNFNLENLKLMYAISDYKSNLPDELEFSENDLITIYAIYPDGIYFFLKVYLQEKEQLI